jgi:lysozyme
MSVPQFVDVSVFQGNIDFTAYCAWAKQFDGIARIAVKSSEGVGFTDPRFLANRAGALAAGIDCIFYYHFGRPDLGNAASDEANSMHSILGAVRPNDVLILDYEVSSSKATAAWAYEWLVQQKANYGKLPAIYASSGYVQGHLQDQRLSRFPLWLANWQYSPDARPPVPAPWSSYEFVQYTDKAPNIPGIQGIVDADIYLGGGIVQPMSTPTTPQGWSDDGVTLKAPDGTPITLGFRAHVRNSNWNAANVPLEPAQHLDSLEQSNPNIGTGQGQLFNWSILEYTQQLGVFEGWLGKELLWYRKQYAAQQAEIANLQAQLAALQPTAVATELAALQAKISQVIKDLS